jgi:hypothetical protein
MRNTGRAMILYQDSTENGLLDGTSLGVTNHMICHAREMRAKRSRDMVYLKIKILSN